MQAQPGTSVCRSNRTSGSTAPTTTRGTAARSYSTKASRPSRPGTPCRRPSGGIADEGIAGFDVGATAWLTVRWGLDVWGTFPPLWARMGPAGRPLHLAAGPGFAGSNGGVAGAAAWVSLPNADIMYGIQAAGSSVFEPGARSVGYGLHLVAVFGFTTDWGEPARERSCRISR